MTQKEFKNLFDVHFAQVRSYIFYRSGNIDVATDIAQDTFLKLWEKQIEIRPGKVKGLLFKMAGDLFVSYYRKEKRSFEFLSHYVFESKNQTPEEELAFEELKERYGKALKNMKEKQRTVFLLSRVENLKYSEIADLLGLSVKAVEKRMKNALDHLRQFLN